MPWSAAAATSASTSARVPISGGDRGVTALRAPDRPGAAGLARLGGGRVVAPLAVGRPDGVDRRQVEHVDAEVGQRRHRLDHPPESSPRAREELVPGADPGALAVDVHLERLRACALRPPRRAPERGHHLRREGRGGPVDGVAVAAQGRGGRRDGGLAGAAQSPGSRLEQRRALDQLAVEILLAGGELALELLLPRAHDVDPDLDLEDVAAERRRREGAAPGVGRELLHRLLGERRRPGRAVAHNRAQLLVPVADDVALHDDGVAEGALDGPPAALDDRTDVMDLDARWLRAGRGCGHGRHSA